MSTHFSSGVTNVSASADMTALRTMDPSQYYCWNDDFMEYIAGNWIVTETDAGSTEAIVSGAGGLFAITNVSAGATDAAQIQWCGSAAAGVLTVFWDATKDLIVKARVKASHATNTAWVVGAATVDTTLAASLPTDGIFFYKASGATSLIASARKAGASTSITLGATVADTFNTMAFVYTASDGTWRGYLDGIQSGETSTASISPTAGLSVGISLLNASAVAHVLTVDYLNIFVQR